MTQDLVEQLTVDARSLVQDRYRSLGEVAIRPLSATQASNQHFIVEGAKGKYILKRVVNPDRLYGEGGIERLKLVSQVILSLGSSDLSVERLRPDDDGSPLVEYKECVYRMFDWIDGGPVSRFDRGLAATQQRLFHDRAHRSLSSVSMRALGELGVPLPLSKTRECFSETRRLIVERIGTSEEVEGIFGKIVSDLDDIQRLVETADFPPSRWEESLIHADYHPQNLLKGPRGIVVIDLDSMFLGARERCLAVSIARWSSTFPGKGGARADLEATTEGWLAEYGLSGSDILGHLSKWIFAIEIEKISRILFRAARGNEYLSFVPNIISRHLPAAALARELGAE